MLLRGVFKLHQGKISTSNLLITWWNRSIPLPLPCPVGVKIRCEGHVLDLGMFVQSPIPSPLFPLWVLALLTLHFADRNHNVLFYELLHQENGILCTLLVRTCLWQQKIRNRSLSYSYSTQHPKRDQPWSRKINSAPPLGNSVLV